MRTTADVKDGTSNTILVVAFPQSTVKWLEPGDLQFDGKHVFMMDGEQNRSVNRAGCGAIMADGPFHKLDSQITPERVAALLTIAGGEPREY